MINRPSTAVPFHLFQCAFFSGSVTPSAFTTTNRFGFPKTGAYRAQFLLESVADLRQSYQAKGSNLVIRRGKPEEEIPALVKSLNIDAVYWHEEVTAEETAVEQSVEKALGALKVASEVYWGETLFHPDDLA